MGALAPISPWIPEDDLLLKNSVEAGASLESLAKGAVRFSRRFTVRELQDRWHSLLYDLDISAGASARMVEFQLSSTNISSKSNRSCNSKGNEWVPGKRKFESVRRHYYAMRKKTRNEPSNSIDLNFLVGSNVHNCIGNRDGCQEQLPLHNELPIGHCMLGDPISNHFGLQETDFGIVHHAFPEMLVDAAAAGGIGDPVHAFHTGDPDSLEDDLPDGIIGRGCLYEFAENVSHLSVKEAVENGINHMSEHNNIHKDIPHILGEDLSVFGNCSGVEEMGPSQALPVGNLFENGDLETKPMSTFDSTNNNPVNVYSGLGGSQGFNSPVSDCSASFHQMGYSSTQPRLLIWETIQDVSAPAMPIDESLGDKDRGAGDTLTLSDDDNAEKISSSGCDVVHSEPKLKEKMSGDGLNSLTAISEGDPVDLSNSLLNFTNEEELLFMDVDGKDMMDRSCLDGLNSLLLSSPNDVHQDAIPSIADIKASVASVTYLDIPGGAYSGELDGIRDPLSSAQDDGHNFCDPKANVPSSTSAPNSHFPELCDENVCCALNIEDPEIPYNDAFSHTQVPLSFASSLTQPNFGEASKPASSAKDFCDNRKSSERRLTLMKEEGENPAQHFAASRMIGALPEMGPNHPVGCCGVKSELPESYSLVAASRNVGTACEDPSQCRSAAHATPNSVLAGELKEEIKKVELRKHHDFDGSFEYFLENPIRGYDHTKSYPQNSSGSFKQERDAPVSIQNHLSIDAESGSIEMAFPELVVNPSTPDQEEQFSESDNDFPYFSDIEAMILGMDLSPDDQDSNFSREVSSYQYEDTKRAIIRLEQGAQSYMQRAIASHGAFAILYGRRLKHYIRKSKVLLGRAADDVNVDINLEREGRANAISRRQAIIKMDKDGSFYLRNLGKCSIFVNSKEVATGQRLSLRSSCLIEIRAMRLMFETNQNSVRRYVANIAQRSQEKNTKFEWSPEEVQ